MSDINDAPSYQIPYKRFTGSTKEGNIAYSTVSQEDANYRAKLMDDNGCVNCTECYNCVNCTDCAYCTDCNNCKSCYYCITCTDCLICTECNKCVECVNCTECDKCRNCYNCYMCDECTECTSCTYCNHCTNVNRWDLGRPTVTRLYTINNLHWPVATDGIYIQIGCQRHTVEEWKNFDDVRISEMDSLALEFWKEHKEQIIQLAEERRRSEEHYQYKESA